MNTINWVGKRGSRGMVAHDCRVWKEANYIWHIDCTIYARKKWIDSKGFCKVSGYFLTCSNLSASELSLCFLTVNLKIAVKPKSNTTLKNDVNNL